MQDRQLGTGHAVECGLTVTGALTGTVLVTYGDVPLLSGETLTALTAEHTAAGNAVTVLTADVPDPHGYGRIVRDDAGTLAAIVEQKDADDAQRAITEINSGIYAFDGAVLSSVLPRLGSANAQGERYLTDAVAIARGDGLPVGTVSTSDPVEIEGVNDRVQLAELSRVLRDRLVRKAQLAGVTVMDPATTWIHADVTIGPDTVLYPDTSLEAGTTIGSGCRIGPATTLSACTVDDGAVVLRSHCEGARIGSGASVGPFTFLRPDADLAAGAKVGAYVEVKKSTIGPKAKVPHLSYIGDATIGAGTNMGAGSITANYDGVRKSDDRHRRERVHRHQQHAGRAGHHRRWRLCGGRLHRHRRGRRRRAGRGPRPTTQFGRMGTAPPGRQRERRLRQGGRSRRRTRTRAYLRLTCPIRPTWPSPDAEDATP